MNPVEFIHAHVLRTTRGTLIRSTVRYTAISGLRDMGGIVNYTPGWEYCVYFPRGGKYPEIPPSVAQRFYPAEEPYFGPKPGYQKRPRPYMGPTYARKPNR